VAGRSRSARRGASRDYRRFAAAPERTRRRAPGLPVHAMQDRPARKIAPA